MCKRKQRIPATCILNTICSVLSIATFVIALSMKYLFLLLASAFKDKTIPVSTYCRAYIAHTLYVKEHSSKERDAAKKSTDM